MKNLVRPFLTPAVFILLFTMAIMQFMGKETETVHRTVIAEDKGNPFHLYAQSAVLMDGSTGRVLYGKNEEIIRPMASTTKIMTCVIALEYGNPSDKVTASQNAAAQPKVHLGVQKGDIFLLEDLLYSLMLESHNDAAMMIAEHVGGSMDGFARLMNQKARDIGCNNTYFITPNGLDAKEEKDGQVKEHATTARDLARIMNYCIGQSPKKEEFLKITGTQNYSFQELSGKNSFTCTNHNLLLTSMNGAFSGKTGFTGGAGYSYVGALKSDGRVYTIALLGCGWPPHKTYKWSDARKLFQYGMDRYRYRDVFREIVLDDIYVKNGVPPSGCLEEAVTVSCGMSESEGKSLKLLLAEDEDVTVQIELPKELKAPVKKGQTVGQVIYSLHGEVIKTYPVSLTEAVEKLTSFWYAQKIIKEYLSMPLRIAIR